MTEHETKLRDCLIRTAQMICHWTGDPIPPLWRTALRDIYETLRDASVAILDYDPQAPKTLAEIVGQDVQARAALQAALRDAQLMEEAAQAAENGAAEPPTVVVGVHGGLVQWVQKSDEKIRVIVRDYDCDGQDEVECGLQRDAEGNLYAEWEER